MLYKLVIGWTCVGVFIATALLTLLALARIIKLADQMYLDRLFKVLILEVVAVCIAAFTGVLQNPDKVEEELVDFGEQQGELAGIKKSEAVLLPQVSKLKGLLSDYQEAQAQFQLCYLQFTDDKDYEGAIMGFKRIAEEFPELEIGQIAAYNIACGYALLDSKDDSLHWLEKAVEMGYKNHAHIEKDPDLALLRREVRYLDLVENLKKPALRTERNDP